MMFIKIKDNVIQGIFDGLNLPDNAVEVPVSFNGKKGENLNLFNSDFSRKPVQQLIDEKIIDLPVGYKVCNNQIVEMSQVEKINAGIEELPEDKKIVDNELVDLSTQEKLDKGLIDETSEEWKTYRIRELQRYLSDTDWYAIRYADTQIAIPDDVKEKRQNARLEISQLRNNDV